MVGFRLPALGFRVQALRFRELPNATPPQLIETLSGASRALTGALQGAHKRSPCGPEPLAWVLVRGLYLSYRNWDL